ncbi:CLUMA_CG005748, isoform A [Clunio marinus]|uniref:CLUMA_CG005748, isoform A n=1 Tax=Clunio marinus TaxID=568069 RepID=A0A1J1HXX4_9DIPT|nr:CLUMA_CG005748, isoform A [Clunio marinus]
MKRSLSFLLGVFISSIVDLTKATPCTVEDTKLSGECKFMTDCPVLFAEYQKYRKMPTICDPRYRTVCCPLEITTTTTTTTQSTKRISERKCHEYGQHIFETKLVPNPVFGELPVEKRINHCAHNVVELIVGGEEAREGEFPHMALIGYSEGKPDDYQCGGSLISEEFILSAAHCSSTSKGVAKFAKLGNIKRYQNTSNSWTYIIEKRILNPNYSSRVAEDDIVLFKLNEVVKLNRFVIPICLPTTDVLTTRKAIASGWGREGFASDVSEVLMKVIIEYFSQETCNRIYSDDSKLTQNGINFDKMICAGSTNKTGDTCDGDSGKKPINKFSMNLTQTYSNVSGGPLQIFRDDVECMYTIVGITSFGSVYCGLIGIPAIYTKVFYYLDWIESIVWPSQ